MESPAKHVVGQGCLRLWLTLATVTLFSGPILAQMPKSSELRILAIVNDEPISAFDLDQRLNLIIRSSSLPDTTKSRRTLAPRVLRSLIDESLKLQEARRLNVSVSAKDLASATRQLERQNRLPPGRLGAFLKARGISKTTLDRQLQAAIAWPTLIRRRFARTVKITDDEVDRALARYTANAKKPRHLLAEIFLAVETPSEETRVRQNAQKIIAELKPRSPSGGVLCSDYQPDKIARRYEQAGAVALSVLTDEKFFGGRATHLTQARAVTSLPVLRKDFIIEESQVFESRHIGADACLLIVGALELNVLLDLKAQIEDLGMVALVEVHDERELDIALTTNATLIGINNRNLHDLSIDRQVIHRLCPLVPDGVLIVSESGITTPQEVRELPGRVNAVLIGTALMRSNDPSGFIRQATEGQEVAK